EGRKTVHTRQAEVEQDDVRPPGRSLADRLFPAAHRPNLQVVIAEPGPQTPLLFNFVVHNQHAAAHASRAGTFASGSVKTNRGPRRRFSARMVPPCASTTRLQIARPSPLPRARRVQKVSNT